MLAAVNLRRVTMPWPRNNVPRRRTTLPISTQIGNDNKAQAGWIEKQHVFVNTVAITSRGAQPPRGGCNF